MRIRHKKTATPKSHPFGEAIWSLDLTLARPQCMPLSALGTIVHKWGMDAPMKQTHQGTLTSLFKELLVAFESRDPGPRYFATVKLAELGFIERIWNPKPLYLDTQRLDFEGVLDAVLTEVHNQKTEKNTAFILKLLPPKLGSEVSFHVITITCDGLWDEKGSFGFQETAYSEGNQGIPTRHWRQFATKANFASALETFVASPALGYEVHRLQAVTIEKDYPQTLRQKILNLILRKSRL